MRRDQAREGSNKPLLAICALGVLLRLLLLLAAGPLELQSDEANYVYLAVAWNRFGVYLDCYRYLWPPGQAWLLARGLDAFGMQGLDFVKLVQVLASASTGLSIMLLARRAFSQRAAVVAGALWCVYLPLAAFTHYLWAEPLFLALLAPALYQTLVAMECTARGQSAGGRVLAAGMLFGASLYFKEVALYLVPLLAVLLVLHHRVYGQGPGRLVEGARRGAILVLATAVVLAPWTLRNLEVYGRFVPAGTSLGENCFNGLNSPYKNFDLVPFTRTRFDAPPVERQVRTWLVASDEPEWPRAEEILNTADRLRENVRRGVRFALDNPGWLLRSRVKKLADLVVPVSFFVRHQGLEHYADSVLGERAVRRISISWAILCSFGALLLAMPGYFATLRSPSARWLFGAVAAYFFASSLLVSMSRFRLPLVPVLLVLSAGFLTGEGWRGLERPRALAWVVLGWAILGVLWWVDLPDAVAVARRAWSLS